jgi:hypothetical protein
VTIKWNGQLAKLLAKIEEEKQEINKKNSRFSVDNIRQSYRIRTITPPPPRGCAGGRIGTRFLRPRGTSPLKGVNPAGTPGYRNGTESFFGFKGQPSVVRDVYIHNRPVLRMSRK